MKNKIHTFSLINTIAIYGLSVFILSSCIVRPGKFEIASKGQKNLNVSVSNIQIINHQIVVTGENLNTVTIFKVNEGSTSINLQIESQDAHSLVANTFSHVTFAAGRVFDFVLSNANASSGVVFSVDFSLCDSSLGGKKFDCLIVPNDKEVLSYDAFSGKWKPRAISGLSYKGVWDATGAAPSATAAGDYYIVSVAGAGYAVGDWTVYRGGGVFDRINNSSAITNVFGRTGAVVPTKGDYDLNDLGDVDLVSTPPNANDVLTFVGGEWVPKAVSAGAGAGGGVTAVSGSSPISVATGTTTPVISISQASGTTNGYLLSSDWTTFNNKQAVIPAGTIAQYYRGDKTWSNLQTDVQTIIAAYSTGGDVSGNLPSLTVAKIRGTSVSTTAPTTGNFFKYNGTNWLGSMVTAEDLKSTALGNLFPGSGCAANQTLYYSVIGDAFTCLDIGSLDGAKITTGIIDVARLPASASYWSAATGGINYSSGNVGIGTTTPAVPLTIQNSLLASSVSPSYTPTQFLISDAPSQTSGIQASDFTINLPSPASTSTATNIATLSQTYVPASSALTYKNLYANFSTAKFAGSGAAATVGSYFGTAYNSGTGTVTNVYGVNTGAHNVSTGTVTNVYGFFSNISNAGGGTITNAYGLYLDKSTPGTITNNYGIYQNDTSNNYFGGRVGIGTSAPSEVLEVAGNVKGTAFLNTSDRRLKNNIVDIDKALEKILSLRGVEFDWKKSGMHEVGLIAQEVEKVEPSLVVTSQVDGLKSVKYGNIVALLIEAMKNEHSKIKEHDQRLENVEREVASLREDIESIKKNLQKQTK